jgi:acetylornithine deacetylase/succinyl-diaminopimelate desuccinylase-like protein
MMPPGMRAEDIDEAVAGEAAWMQGLLVDLVEARTLLGQEDPGQALMARAFADCGLEPVDIPMVADAIRADPHHSPFSWSVAGKRNVTATWRGEPEPRSPGRSLVLNGHVDVVPPASEPLWTSGPFTARRDGDWLYGRGAADMKAGLVAMTGAVRALRRRGVRLRGDVHLQSVVEEECTGNGTLQCLLAGSGANADAAILTEPHPDHVTVAQVGVLWFHVDVRGVPAHAGHAAALGHNAFEAALRVLAALRELEALCLDRESAHYKEQVALKYAEMVYFGQWFTPLRESLDAFVNKLTEAVSGTVRLKLYKGNVIIAGRTSPHTLYRPDLASFTMGASYDQRDAAGFIRLNALRLRTLGRRRKKLGR